MTCDEHETCVVLLKAELDACHACGVAGGTACYCTSRDPTKATVNEDALAILSAGGAHGVVAVADGFGGQPSGDRASEIAVGAVVDAVRGLTQPDHDLREAILTGFERANEQILALGVGAATTLTVVEVQGRQARAYHAGDSEVLVVGQRGKIKLTTTAHSPVGYALEAGVISEQDALHHDDRHLVSNMVGTSEMRIDVGPVVHLRPRDTLLLATDGLFDNMSLSEIIDTIRAGPLRRAGEAILTRCRERMTAPQAGAPSKPDDLTFALYRLS